MRESVAQAVMMVAGEPSGDRHAAEVARALRRMRPEVQLWGMGGPFMREAGVELLEDISKVTVMGISEVLGKISAILSARRKLLARVGESPPHLAILVDFPDFNLWLAKSLKRKGVKVLYYIAPQAWAWRPKRVKVMAKVVDHLAVILPFEEEFFRKGGVKAQFVGHPLLEETDLKIGREEAKRVLGLGEPGVVLGLFPGSRIQEVRRMLPVMLDAANLVLSHYPEVKPVVALSPNADEPWVRSMVDEGCPEAMVRSGMAQLVLAASDVASVASGTVSLEAALFEVPMIVVYRTSWFNYQVAKRLVRVRNVSLVNILAGEEIVPEIIQNDLQAGKLAQGLLELLGSREKREKMRAAMGKIREKLGDGRPSEKVAITALEMIDGDARSPRPSPGGGA